MWASKGSIATSRSLPLQTKVDVSVTEETRCWHRASSIRSGNVEGWWWLVGVGGVQEEEEEEEEEEGEEGGMEEREERGTIPSNLSSTN